MAGLSPRREKIRWTLVHSRDWLSVSSCLVHYEEMIVTIEIYQSSDVHRSIIEVGEELQLVLRSAWEDPAPRPFSG